MKQRKLGNQGLIVSEIGYGAMGTAVGYGPTNDAQSVKAIRQAHEMGVTHFDTAHMYGWGEGEKLLGIALAPFRDKVTIATKFGIADEQWNPDSSLQAMRKSVENSLQNLKIETIDVLYQHVHDPKIPVEEVIGEMQRFVEEGKVRYLGMSNSSTEMIKRAMKVAPISVYQMEYSIFSRGVEAVLPYLRELGIGLVAYSPLARGFLSGAVKPRDAYSSSDFRQWMAWWAPENFSENVALAEELNSIAESKGCKLSQLAIAWLLAKGGDIVPIPGSRSVERVAENIGSADILLTSEDLIRIDAIALNGAQGGIIG
ncbi:aldo/keto reductase [Erwinia sp. S63]|uniref:aldo/keto reductase n=1 Tax=Erwiniaceae TaxID=1903409 RepID=UPI00190D73F4|nr:MULTISPECIES: aldo/keto reductase [Erwiniaceae]MBK0004795.1 aldo/keto reductase [Erwinia sp. S38]MBK0093610.1 aldo/keto reductase [Erwinia sp. S59]MBK0099331.1 aldo/keto reductase [Erwinia sp. S63]MBK0127321.1 aldo/keto reductase [Pantoea sp. S61]